MQWIEKTCHYIEQDHIKITQTLIRQTPWRFALHRRNSHLRHRAWFLHGNNFAKRTSFKKETSESKLGNCRESSPSEFFRNEDWNVTQFTSKKLINFFQKLITKILIR